MPETSHTFCHATEINLQHEFAIRSRPSNQSFPSFYRLGHLHHLSEIKADPFNLTFHNKAIGPICMQMPII